MIPKSWPYNQNDSILYTNKNIYSRSVSSSTVSQLNKSSTILGLQAEHMEPSPMRTTRVKRILETSHPAFGQYGLFASRNLSPGSLILDYVGIVDLYENANDKSDYCMNFIRGVSGLPDLVIDAEKVGNESRFINDYRGIGHHPNAKFELYWNKCLCCIQVGVWILDKKVVKGDEILVSYGKGFWSHRLESRECN